MPVADGETISLLVFRDGRVFFKDERARAGDGRWPLR